MTTGGLLRRICEADEWPSVEYLQKADNDATFGTETEFLPEPGCYTQTDKSGAKHWYRYGKAHREDGPAYTGKVGGNDVTKWWYKDGQLQKIGYEDGTFAYWVNGVFVGNDEPKKPVTESHTRITMAEADALFPGAINKLVDHQRVIRMVPGRNTATMVRGYIANGVFTLGVDDESSELEFDSGHICILRWKPGEHKWVQVGRTYESARVAHGDGIELSMPEISVLFPDAIRSLAAHIDWHPDPTHNKEAIEHHMANSWATAELDATGQLRFTFGGGFGFPDETWAWNEARGRWTMS